MSRANELNEKTQSFLRAQHHGPKNPKINRSRSEDLFICRLPFFLVPMACLLGLENIFSLVSRQQTIACLRRMRVSMSSFISIVCRYDCLLLHFPVLLVMASRTLAKNKALFFGCFSHDPELMIARESSP